MVGDSMERLCVFFAMEARRVENTFSVGVVLVDGFGLELWLTAP